MTRSGDGRPALEVLEGGVSNSRLSDTSVAFAGSGFDTVGVGRADLASELRFIDGREGHEFLRALSYVDLPWLKVGTEGGKRDRLETVYHRNVRGRSVALRCYDKGVESKTCTPGMWLRLERQRRSRKDQEGTVQDVIGRGLAEAFGGTRASRGRGRRRRGDRVRPASGVGAATRALREGRDHRRHVASARRLRARETPQARRYGVKP